MVEMLDEIHARLNNGLNLTSGTQEWQVTIDNGNIEEIRKVTRIYDELFRLQRKLLTLHVCEHEVVFSYNIREPTYHVTSCLLLKLESLCMSMTFAFILKLENHIM